ncbi:MAG TPA: hypothetical protein VMT56_00795 [Candidatus Bathyarchaeia archaeon]|nr:hypothetical protein [Candidatus Bathyarchaeia archaeon]
MTPLVRCSVCGYITAEGKLKDRCPACGAPRAAFEAFIDPVSEQRRRFLNLNIHPAAIHFPQAFATVLFALSLTPLIFSGVLGELFFSTEKVLAVVLPVAIAATMLAGLLDGRARFRGIRRSLILKRKIVAATLFFGFSLGLVAVTWLKDPADSLVFNTWAGILALGAFACSLALGRLGAKVAGPIVPGD